MAWPPLHGSGCQPHLSFLSPLTWAASHFPEPVSSSAFGGSFLLPLLAHGGMCFVTCAFSLTQHKGDQILLSWHQCPGKRRPSLTRLPGPENDHTRHCDHPSVVHSLQVLLKSANGSFELFQARFLSCSSSPGSSKFLEAKPTSFTFCPLLLSFPLDKPTGLASGWIVMCTHYLFVSFT